MWAPQSCGLPLKKTPSVFLLFRGNGPTPTHIASVELPDESNLHVYPNPATDQLTVSHWTGQVQVFDLLGRKVLDKQVDSQRQVAVDHLPDGMYVYRFLANPTSESYSGQNSSNNNEEHNRCIVDHLPMLSGMYTHTHHIHD